MLAIRHSNYQITQIQHEALTAEFGSRLRENVLLDRYTAARVGGPADLLLEARSADELARMVAWMWEHDISFLILGGGSNVLVSDAGVRQVVVINRARQVRFDDLAQPPTVWAESGANFGLVARQAAQRGLAGLEWAAGIPGTVGGAVFGNAGAHGGDLAGCLVLAEILQHSSSEGIEKPEGANTVRENWPVEKMGYEYRSSILKRSPGQAVVLSATLRLERSTPSAVGAKLDEFVSFRRRTQPPGASMGSMFKNPPADYAGRLIEDAGLKGMRVGDAQISTLHANFFINQGKASAADISTLIRIARGKVAERFGVNLDLEIELVGEWKPKD
jgi:UDP-N-acetylmuramate dehydrogenase